MIHRLEWECHVNKNRDLYYQRDATAFKFVSKFNHISLKKMEPKMKLRSITKAVINFCPQCSMF